MAVSGKDKVIRNIRKVLRRKFRGTVLAVEVTSVKVAEHAKAGHDAHAHAIGRYVNRTALLTRSILPQMGPVTKQKVTATVCASMEYAKDVELGTHTSRAYPFMTPALTENAEFFKKILTTYLKE